MGYSDQCEHFVQFVAIQKIRKPKMWYSDYFFHLNTAKSYCQWTGKNSFVQLAPEYEQSEVSFIHAQEPQFFGIILQVCLRPLSMF